MKKIIKLLMRIVELFLSPFVYGSSLLIYVVRKVGFNRLKISKRVIMKAGIYPIIDHYHEPLFNKKHLNLDRKERILPGVNWNIDEQLNIVKKFKYQRELNKIPVERSSNDLEYYYNNDAYQYGDGALLYCMIRLFKPKKLIEIGSGFSTLMSVRAINKNKSERIGYDCEMQCIEPYERSWLEKIGVNVIREKAEKIDIDIFKELKRNDILFIDSSHIIRPQGDVLFIYLNILPMLNKGVIIHSHDIFSPKDYSFSIFDNNIMFWNEQYLLEAFLTSNKDFRVLLALNMLKHNHFDLIAEKCPIIKEYPNHEPGAFWIHKVK